MVASELSNATRRGRRTARRGMTLLELILVLALLVMIGALAMPAFRVPFEYHRLRQAGEVVRVEWNKARIRAMQTGQTLMFRYAAQQNAYQVTPYYSEQDWLEADAAHSPTLGGGGVNMQAGAVQAADDALAESRELPEGVVFVDSEVEIDLRSYEIQQQVQGNQLAGALEATPILFYPDGTTSDARVVLTNQYQQLFIVVKLRSLTGIATVSDFLSSHELQQYP